MTRLLTTSIATITELREPQKVLERAAGEPVAILKNSRCVGYFVPIEFIDGPPPQEDTASGLASTTQQAQIPETKPEGFAAPRQSPFTTMERVVEAIREQAP